MHLLNTNKRVSRWRRNTVFLVLLTGITAVGAFEHVETVKHNRELQNVANTQQKIIQQSKEQIAQKDKQLQKSNSQIKNQQKQIQTLKKRVQQLSERGQDSIGNMDITSSLTMIATWYDNQGGINGTGITKIGTPPIDGVTVAVDPQVIPLHSRILVKFRDGHTHEYIAQDTGSAIIGNRIDIYDSNSHECFTNGIQTVTVMVIK